MNSYPWDSLAVSVGEDGYPIYDRAYMASDLQGVQGRFFSNGIFVDEPSAYRPIPGDGMSVMVDVGWCCINGTFGYPSEKPSEQRKMVLQAADSKNRIDTVVLRWNTNAEKRTIDLYVVAGAPSDVPVRPELNRSDTVYELGICDVLVPAYTTEVKAERITDTRLENARCGVCVPFAPVSTTEFYEQLREQTNVAVELANAAIDDSIYGEIMGKFEEFAQLMHPVGSYYWSDDPTSPASLFGGEWEKLSGVFLRAGDNTGTGGSDTVSLSVDNMPSHTHTGPSHTHTGPSHTHTGPSHTHTGPSHTHKYNAPNSTSGSTTLTADQIPSHTHKARIYAADSTAGSIGSFATKSWMVWSSTYANNAVLESTGGGKGHTHSVGSSSTNTGSDGTGNTGSAGTGATGSAGTGATGSAGTGATGSAGSGTAFSVMPKYRNTHVWRRVA